MTLLTLLRPVATAVDRPGSVATGAPVVALVEVGATGFVGGVMADVGDMVRFGNAAVDPATGAALVDPPEAFETGGAAADPTTVVLIVQRPDGTKLHYGWPSAGADGTLARESAGRFYADVEIDQSGTWRYRIQGSGAVVAAAEGSLRVTRQRVTA